MENNGIDTQRACIPVSAFNSTKAHFLLESNTLNSVTASVPDDGRLLFVFVCKSGYRPVKSGLTTIRYRLPISTKEKKRVRTSCNNNDNKYTKHVGLQASLK